VSFSTFKTDKSKSEITDHSAEPTCRQRDMCNKLEIAETGFRLQNW